VDVTAGRRAGRGAPLPEPAATPATPEVDDDGADRD
jgi:hypothetical protein